MDAITLAIYSQLFAAICDEMGTALMRSAFSPNIKERRDFSTALFTPDGRMLAQAAHIPVHLGSMGFAVRGVLEALTLHDGDVALLNDPYRGGTHLPDLTVVTPVHATGRLVGYAATRAHHADIGGSTPGSMPVARSLAEEGLIIGPCKLVEAGRINTGVLAPLLAAVRTPDERRGDLDAQTAACRAGAARLAALCDRDGVAAVLESMEAVLAHGERVARAAIAELPPGTYRASDRLDDDGFGHLDLPIVCSLTVEPTGALVVDFSGTAPQTEGNLNAVFPVTFAAVAYCLRCLMPPGTPSSAGCWAPLRLFAPPGTLVNPLPPAPVAAGNVETSQRIVDVVLAALARAVPHRIPAASAGTMNNLALGGTDPRTGRAFSYYETIGGGMGGRPGSPGLDAVQTHMTNTLNTPVESLELHYPLRVERYSLRDGSGGPGLHPGGRGVVREIRALADGVFTLLTERRRHAPPGAAGGLPGKRGRNLLVEGPGATPPAGTSSTPATPSSRHSELLPGKVTRAWKAGDLLRIETPGGGGWGPVPAAGRTGRRQRQ